MTQQELSEYINKLLNNASNTAIFSGVNDVRQTNEIRRQIFIAHLEQDKLLSTIIEERREEINNIASILFSQRFG